MRPVRFQARRGRPVKGTACRCGARNGWAGQPLSVTPLTPWTSRRAEQAPDLTRHVSLAAGPPSLMVRNHAARHLGTIQVHRTPNRCWDIRCGRNSSADRRPMTAAVFLASHRTRIPPGHDHDPIMIHSLLDYAAFHHSAEMARIAPSTPAWRTPSFAHATR